MADQYGKPSVSENPTPEELDKLREFLEEVRSARVEMEQEAQVNNDDALRKAEAERLTKEIEFELNAAKIAHEQLNPPAPKEQEYSEPPSNDTQFLGLGQETSSSEGTEGGDNDPETEGN